MSAQRVDFYQLSRDPVHQVVALLAGKVMEAGDRLLVVSGSAEQRDLVSKTLWEDETSFLAHGMASMAHVERQPILLSDVCEAPNGARMVILADGVWREEAAGFDRAMLLFDNQARDAAADLWRRLAADKTIDNRIHKQNDRGGWREGR